jgi:Glycosyltransferase
VRWVRALYSEYFKNFGRGGHKVTILITTDHDQIFKWQDDITVITLKHKNIDRKKGINQYINLIECFSSNDFWKTLKDYLNRSWEINDKIKQINRRTPVDIVQYWGTGMAVWYRLKNIPSVVRLSNFGPWYAQASCLGSDMEDMGWLNTWESRFLLYSYAKADAVYGPSNAVAEIVNKKRKNKIRVIESPCVINDSMAIGDVIPELKGKKYLLSFGRISILKGFGVIKEAIYDILEKHPQLIYVLAGREETPNLLHEIEVAAGKYRDRILYLGDIREADKLYSIIKGAYACALPSRADNLPNACIEAMGLGKIVIGTYGASFEQLIRHKDNGILIKRDSPKALLKAIDYLMELTEEESIKMGEKAKERVAKMSPEIIYGQLISL